MADTKITALAAIATVDPAADVLPIVDISDTSMAASGTTKKVTSNQILGAGGTATLASATITGAATVGTTLGVTGVSTFAAGTALLPALTTTGDTNTGIYYPAADTFAVTTGGTERYRVDSTGLGIGASPSYKLDLLSTGYCESRIRSSGNGQQISLRLETKNSDTTDCKILLGCGVTGNNQFLIQDTVNTKNLYLINGVGNSTNDHLWYSGGATATMTLDASGNLLVGLASANANGGVLQLKSGITFPATQVAASDANTLDDYEEGTFTPTVVGTTIAGVGVYSVQAGRYTKVGNLVSVQVYITWSAHTGTGNLRFSGLPFNISADSNYYSAVTFGFVSDLALTASNILTAYASTGSANIDAYQYPVGGGSSTAVPMDGAAAIIYSVTYKV